MKLSIILQVALLYTLVAFATAQQQGDLKILCDSQDDCWGKNALCENGQCSCSWGFTWDQGDCFLDEEQYSDEEFSDHLRLKRSPGSKVEKLEKKLIKAQIKEAKKHGGVAHVHTVPVVPVVHVPVVHTAPVLHVSRHRRTPGGVSKLERKIIKSQVKRVAKKESRRLIKGRPKRDSNKKIEKLERKLVKEQVKQAKKDAKKGRIAYVAAPAYGPVVYHQPPVYTQTHTKSKPKGLVARAKSYLG